MENRQSRRRSLSVARYQCRHSEVGALEGKNGLIRKGVSDGDARRKRSVSVARYGHSDLEVRELDGKGILVNNGGMRNVSDSNLRRRRSLSVARYHGSDSESYSSSLTEDEGWHVHADKNGFEKTIRGVYAQNKVDHLIGDREETGLYEAMREQVRHAVEEMRTEIEQVMGKGRSNEITNSNGVQSRNSDITKNVTEIRSYTTEMEQRTDEQTWMSKRLNKEAEMYFENFMSSVEDTDVSSFDGEKSDMNSTLGGSINSKNLLHCAIDETAENLARTISSPVDSDGVILPWLEWETSSDCSPLLCKSNTTGNNLLNSSLETSPAYNNNSSFTSSHGSCSPGGDDCPSMVSKSEIIRDSDEIGCHISTSRRSKSVFNMEDYLQLQRGEDLLLERLRLKPRIESGGLVFCGAGFI
ncbi:hypothetical protein QJS04_geneDACA013768 [Acorus gramineus]|uniref:Uncharacterized protein n=1 Tax=Acorus gramineus TaxID=55184 RepID=A0AAV9AUA9_ACOGR|nr:hypothetical protein QJS04_geneDACA013768 [Acorus gramineus]